MTNVLNLLALGTTAEFSVVIVLRKGPCNGYTAAAVMACTGFIGPRAMLTRTPPRMSQRT